LYYKYFQTSDYYHSVQLQLNLEQKQQTVSENEQLATELQEEKHAPQMPENNPAPHLPDPPNSHHFNL
jgi:hypothetical protein